MLLLSRYRGRTICPDCHGYRLRKEALYVKVQGKHIGELSEMPIKDLKDWFDDLQKKVLRIMKSKLPNEFLLKSITALIPC